MSLDLGAIDDPSQAGEAHLSKADSSQLRTYQRPTRVRYLVLVWLCVATTIAYLDRGCISLAEIEIRKELGITASQMGYVMSAFFLTYACFQLPSAALDRLWGTRRALPFFSAAWSLATGLCGLATGVWLLLPARLAMGAAEAGIFPSSTGVIGRWFPASRRALASGIYASFMGVGGAVGALLSALILEWTSWRWMFLIYTVPGVLWAIGFWLWFRDTPGEHPAVNQAEKDLITGGVEPVVEKRSSAPFPWRVLRSRAVVGLASQQFFRAFAAIFYMSWFPTFLRVTRGVEHEELGILASMPHWATMVGSLAGGSLSDLILERTGSLRLARQGVGGASMLVCTLCIGLAFLTTNAWWTVLILSVGALAAAIAGPCAYALTIDLGRQNTPQVFSVMNASGAIGAVIFPSIGPWLVAASGSWNALLALVAVAHLVAAACWVAFDADRPLDFDEEIG